MELRSTKSLYAASNWEGSDVAFWRAFRAHCHVKQACNQILYQVPHLHTLPEHFSSDITASALQFLRQWNTHQWMQEYGREQDGHLTYYEFRQLAANASGKAVPFMA